MAASAVAHGGLTPARARAVARVASNARSASSRARRGVQKNIEEAKIRGALLEIIIM